MDNEHKKVSFRMDVDTYNRLQEVAKEKYLSVSAYIRKTIDKSIESEEKENELS